MIDGPAMVVNIESRCGPIVISVDQVRLDLFRLRESVAEVDRQLLYKVDAVLRHLEMATKTQAMTIAQLIEDRDGPLKAAA